MDIKRPGKLDNGTPSQVPKFVFRDPASQAKAATRRDVDRAPMVGIQQDEANKLEASDAPISAGLPLLLCPSVEGSTERTYN